MPILLVDTPSTYGKTCNFYRSIVLLSSVNIIWKKIIGVDAVELCRGLVALSGPRIAAVDGVDVLFIGPLDLTVNMGIREQFDHPDFLDAKAKVANAAKNAGKSSGILLLNADQVPETVEAGFTFVALGSDGGLVAADGAL